jgi:hypothetical protein
LKRKLFTEIFGSNVSHQTQDSCSKMKQHYYNPDISKNKILPCIQEELGHLNNFPQQLNASLQIL